MPSILLSDLDRAFFFHNVHAKHSDMVRDCPSLIDLDIPTIIKNLSPRAEVRPVRRRLVISIIWVLLTAKPNFDAPAQALRPKTIGDILKGMRQTIFNPNGSLFNDDGRDEEDSGYASGVREALQGLQGSIRSAYFSAG